VHKVAFIKKRSLSGKLLVVGELEWSNSSLFGEGVVTTDGHCCELPLTSDQQIVAGQLDHRGRMLGGVGTISVFHGSAWIAVTTLFSQLNFIVTYTCSTYS